MLSTTLPIRRISAVAATAKHVPADPNVPGSGFTLSWLQKATTLLPPPISTSSPTPPPINGTSSIPNEVLHFKQTFPSRHHKAARTAMPSPRLFDLEQLKQSLNQVDHPGVKRRGMRSKSARGRVVRPKERALTLIDFAQEPLDWSEFRTESSTSDSGQTTATVDLNSILPEAARNVLLANHTMSWQQKTAIADTIALVMRRSSPVKVQ